MRRSGFGAGSGAAVLVGVVAISFGWDTGVLRRLSLTSTSGIEQKLVDRFHPVAYAKMDGGDAGNADAAAPAIDLKREGPMPSLDGAVKWLNSAPLSTKQLKGKVVVIDFWTYSCINCLRAVPYVEAWWEKYKDDGLVVIGVHTPEFAFEKDAANVQKSLGDLKITYPVAVDSNYAIWNAFHNRILAGALFHRCRRADSLSPFRRREVRRVGASDSAVVEREGREFEDVRDLVQVNGTGAQAAPDSKRCGFA